MRKGDKTGNHLINWEIIRRNKVYGGLGVDQIDKMNSFARVVKEILV